MTNLNRINCPVCKSETEFVQFGGSESATTETEPSEVGDGLLELRICTECEHGVENILQAKSQTVVE